MGPHGPPIHRLEELATVRAIGGAIAVSPNPVVPAVTSRALTVGAGRGSLVDEAHGLGRSVPVAYGLGVEAHSMKLAGLVGILQGGLGDEEGRPITGAHLVDDALAIGPAIVAL